MDVELEEKNPPDILWHGTAEKYVAAIVTLRKRTEEACSMFMISQGMPVCCVAHYGILAMTGGGIPSREGMNRLVRKNRFLLNSLYATLHLEETGRYLDKFRKTKQKGKGRPT